MKMIFDAEYWTIWLDAEHNIFRVLWKSGAENMPKDLFKQYLLDFIQEVEKYNVIGFLTDARQAHIVMTTDMQEWHDKTIAPAYIKHGIKKIGFLLPEEIFAAVSINQTMEEEQSQAINVGFFENEADAIKWFKA